MKTQAGFSLVELVTVMVLLGILSVMVLPRFFDNDIYKERGFQDLFAADVRFAQKKARFSGCEVRVLTTSGSYNITQRAGCSSGTFSVAVSRLGDTSDPVSESAPSGVTLTVDDFYFDSRGRPWDNATSTLWNSSVDLSVGSKTLRIEAETGYTYWL